MTATTKPDKTRRMPVLFVGHGTPMNAVQDNRWHRGFAKLAGAVPKPKAILAVSAHWYVGGTLLTGNAKPRTIHDFHGFPKQLYEVQYPAPGNVDLAKRVRKLLGEQRAALSSEWGFDHGTWSVVRCMYPAADVPLIQLSINSKLDIKQHLELGRSLRELRHQDVLIVASGNVTHNLGDAIKRMRAGDASDVPAWASRFDDTVKRIFTMRDDAAMAALPRGSDYSAAHPSPDHFLPLVYAYAAASADDKASFPIEGFDHGLSMRSILLG